MRIRVGSSIIFFITVITSQQLAFAANSPQTEESVKQQSPIPCDKDKDSRVMRATAIARVKYIRLQGGSKYTWEVVQILETIKNTSKQKLEGEVAIAHYFQNPGIPGGESTVYLVPYSDHPNSGWKLLSE